MTRSLLSFLFIVVVCFGCSSEAPEPEPNPETDQEVVDDGNEPEEEEEEEESEETTPSFSNTIAVLTRIPNGTGSDYLINDYKQGDQAINESEPINISNSIDILAGSNYRLIENNLFFWSAIATTLDFLQYDLVTNIGTSIQNYEVVTDQERMSANYQLCLYPTANYLVTLNSNNANTGSLAVYENSVYIYDPSDNTVDIVELPGENYQSCNFFRHRSYNDIYFFNNHVGDNGSRWDVIDLSTKALIANFDLPNPNATFGIYGDEVIFSDGSAYDYRLDSSTNGYDFPSSIGFPDMAEAVFENDIMVTTSNSIVKENRITKGVIVYDLANQTYKSITLLDLQDKLIELSSSQKILNDIYDVVYDFENEIMALSFTTSFPEFGVMFVDLEANILEYHVFEGTEPPLDLFRIE